MMTLLCFDTFFAHNFCWNLSASVKIVNGYARKKGKRCGPKIHVEIHCDTFCRMKSYKEMENGQAG